MKYQCGVVEFSVLKLTFSKALWNQPKACASDKEFKSWNLIFYFSHSWNSLKVENENILKVTILRKKFYLLRSVFNSLVPESSREPYAATSTRCDIPTTISFELQNNEGPLLVCSVTTESASSQFWDKHTRPRTSICYCNGSLINTNPSMTSLLLVSLWIHVDTTRLSLRYRRHAINLIKDL